MSSELAIKLSQEISFFERKIKEIELKLRACEDVGSAPFVDFDGEHLQDIINDNEREYQRYCAQLAVSKAALERLMPTITEDGEVRSCSY